MLDIPSVSVNWLAQDTCTHVDALSVNMRPCKEEWVIVLLSVPLLVFLFPFCLLFMFACMLVDFKTFFKITGTVNLHTLLYCKYWIFYSLVFCCCIWTLFSLFILLLRTRFPTSFLLFYHARSSLFHLLTLQQSSYDRSVAVPVRLGFLDTDLILKMEVIVNW